MNEVGHHDREHDFHRRDCAPRNCAGLTLEQRKKAVDEKRLAREAHCQREHGGEVASRRAPE
jgi:hypothetical protein